MIVAMMSSEHFEWVAFGSTAEEARDKLHSAFMRKLDGDPDVDSAEAWLIDHGMSPTPEGLDDFYGIHYITHDPAVVAWMDGSPMQGREEEYKRGPACPDCGSAATTLYPVDEEGALTLYCDDCKREEPYVEEAS